MKRIGRKLQESSNQKRPKWTFSSPKVTEQRNQCKDRIPTKRSRRAKVADYQDHTGILTSVYNNKKLSNQSLHRTVNSRPPKTYTKRRRQSRETTETRAKTTSNSTLTLWITKRMPEIGKFKAKPRTSRKLWMPSGKTNYKTSPVAR